MCFIISPRKTAPRNRYGWKVLTLTRGGYLRSGMGKAVATYWQPGEYKVRSNGPTFIKHYNGTRRLASCGIYVYFRKRDAEYSNWWGLHMGDQVLVKVLLHPDDWLWTSINNRIATYQRVFLPEEQPYVEFY